jgi:hypothetical protein
MIDKYLPDFVGHNPILGFGVRREVTNEGHTRSIGEKQTNTLFHHEILLPFFNGNFGYVRKVDRSGFAQDREEARHYSLPLDVNSSMKVKTAYV